MILLFLLTSSLLVISHPSVAEPFQMTSFWSFLKNPNGLRPAEITALGVTLSLKSQNAYVDFYQGSPLIFKDIAFQGVDLRVKRDPKNNLPLPNVLKLSSPQHCLTFDEVMRYAPESVKIPLGRNRSLENDVFYLSPI